MRKKTMNHEELWLRVQDILDDWGDGDGRLCECSLREDDEGHSYVLEVPQWLMSVVEEKVGLIEDAFEQLLTDHDVSVSPVVMEEGTEEMDSTVESSAQANSEEGVM